MDALENLHNRISINRLTEPAPSGAVLENIMRAALRAADHGRLQPWRFLVIEGDGLDHLGKLFVDASGDDLNDAVKEKVAAKPHRAPMIIVAIASPRDLPKIPVIEQVISTGAAVQNMLNAAFAQGVGAMWRTGGLAYNPQVKEGLGLDEAESIVGFLYLGAPAGAPCAVTQDQSVDKFFRHWPAD